MAMFIMFANCSGIVGSQLFQAKDAPKYRTGWTIVVCLISTAIVFATSNVIRYWISNKRIDASREGRRRMALANSVLIDNVKYHL
jgi:hypothetical protein